MKRYTVRYERDESGWWIATVAGVRGCHTQGRTITQTRKRIREALGLFIGNADVVELIDQIRLPRNASRVLDRVYSARKRAEEETTRLQQSTDEAVRILNAELGVSLRDTAELLGLSHQRIHQLVAALEK